MCEGHAPTSRTPEPQAAELAMHTVAVGDKLALLVHRIAGTRDIFGWVRDGEICSNQAEREQP
jgi:hypothetical protein